MEEFNLSKINIYSIDELVDFILSGSTTREQLYRNGLFSFNRPLLEKALKGREVKDWEQATEQDSIEAYKKYLSSYGTMSHYVGSHSEEANDRIEELMLLNEKNHPSINIEPEIDTPNGFIKPEPIPEILPEPIPVDVPDEDSENENAKGESDESEAQDESESELGTDTSAENNSELDEDAANDSNYEGIDTSNNYDDSNKENDSNEEDDVDGKSESNEVSLKSKKIRNLLTLNKFGKIAVASVAICVVLCLSVLGLKYFTKLAAPKSLSQDEIAEIIKEKQDSLKIDLFDGFYLIPATKGQGNDSIKMCSVETQTGSELNGPTSKEEVLAEYVSSLNGKYNIANRDGVILKIPGASNGIDSICLKDSPFIEYIDNNGLRRVVALYNDEMYYYAGDCGSVDNIRQFILVNQEGKYGILNINKQENKRFENDKIEQIASSQRYYVMNNGVKTEYQNGHEYTPPVSSSSSSSSTSSSSSNKSNQLHYFSVFDSAKRRSMYGYKDSQGNIVIKPQYINAWNFNGNYAKVQGPNGYGIINKSNVKCVPLQYKRLDLLGSNAIAQNANDMYGLISVSNKILIPFKYKHMSKYGNYINVTTSDGKEGLFDINGNRILNDIYEDIACFSINDGLIPCKLNGFWGYMFTSGGKAIDFKYKYANGFSSYGLAAVKDSVADKYGYINKSGKYIINPIFYSAGSITENGAEISNSEGLKARIDRDGNIITQFYEEVGHQFNCDRIWVVADSLIGFSDNKKQLAIPCIFDKTSKTQFDSYTHLCKVSYKGIEWYINTNGAFCYPASSNLKPTDQNIQAQIDSAIREREEKEKAERERKGKNNDDRKRR